MALPSPIAVGQKITAAFLNALLTGLTQRPAAASGSVVITPTVLNTGASTNVTFPASRFGTAPIVAAVLNTGSSSYLVSVSAVTTTQATITLTQTAGTLAARQISWIAVEST